MKISDVSVNRPVTTLVIYAALIVLGLFSLARLAIDLIPDISFPMITIMSSYPGAAPPEVEENLSRVLENTAAAAANVKKVTSSSREGQSVITVEFVWGTNMSEAAADMREKLDMVRNRLPEDATQPVIFKFDPSQIPVTILTVEGSRDLRSLRYFSEQELKNRLEQVDGVANVQIYGGLERQIQVALSRAALAAYGVSVDQVIGMLQVENLNLTGGTVSEGNLVYSLRTTGRLQNLSELKKLIVTRINGVPIYLENMASIYDGYKENKSEMRVGNKQAVIGIVQKQSGTNTVQVSRKVKQAIKSLQAALPRDVQIVELYTPADFIEKAIQDVGQSALQGGLLAILVLLLFLRNLPITLIISVSIPLSVIITFIFMYLFNLTLNMMSLGGLALGVGMLVDNSIVVLENIFRYRENGTKPLEAAKLGTQEMAMPIIASTLTTVAVFLPLVLFIRGMARELFKDLAFTVTFSLMASLLVAMTIIPMLTGRVRKVKIRKMVDSLRNVEEELASRGPVMRFVDRLYSGVLNLTLRHRLTVFVLILAVFAASLALIPVVGVVFMPESDEGMIVINVDTPVGSSLAVTESPISRLETVIDKSVPELDRKFVQVGRLGDNLGTARESVGSVWLFLSDKSKRTRGINDIMKDIRQQAADIPGTTLRFSTGHGTTGSSSGLTLSVKGYELKKGKELAEKIKTAMESVENVTDVRISREEGLPEYRITVDRERAAQYGLTVAQVGTTLKRAFAGEAAAKMILEGEEVEIYVRLREQDRLHHQDLSLLTLAAPTGTQVPLANLVAVEKSFGPVEIQREGQQRVINIDARVNGDMRKAVAKIQDKIRELAIPPGFTILYGGSWEDFQDTLKDLVLVAGLAILLVYFIMAAQFESFYDPFLIMFTLPMTFIGVVWTHIITGTTFSAISGIGVIMLAGIVVNNGIILVDYTNLLRKRGYSVLDAVKVAGRTRLRPILMTTLTTILGLVPMSLRTGSGSEMQAPMAQTVLGGLAVSTIFTLVLIPVLYASFELRKEKRKMKREAVHA